MKTLDLIGIALKNLKGRWAALPVAGFAIGAFCLCFAGTVFVTVQQEKLQPCELAVSAQGNVGIPDATIAKILKIPGVTGASPLLIIPVTIRSGDYTARLTLTGIDSTYLGGSFKQGETFPRDSAMPAIVLNEAACKLFSESKAGAEPDTGADGGSQEPSGVQAGDKDASGSADVPDASVEAAASDNTGAADTTDAADATQAPPINWLTAAFTVKTGDGARPVVSKVCDILADEKKGQEPAAYISLSTAKQLLQYAGQSAAVVTAKVRILNIGHAESVSTAITALGLTVQGEDEGLQAKWDAETNEMGYLLVTGVFGLLCAMVLLSAWRRISLLEQREAWGMLLYMGMRERNIGRLFLLQAVVVSLLGAAIGIIVAVALPSFLPQDLVGESIFMLLIPVWVAAADLALCVLMGLFSLISTEKKLLRTL